MNSEFIYDLNQIVDHAKKSEYYDFERWWNHNFAETRVDDLEFEVYPFSIHFILYLLYINGHRIVKKSIVENIMYHLQMTIDYIESESPLGTDLTINIKYKFNNNDLTLLVEENPKFILFYTKYKKVMSPDDQDTQEIVDFWNRYNRLFKKNPTIKMLTNYLIRCVVDEYLCQFSALETDEITSEILRNVIVELKNDYDLGFIIPPCLI